jgi:hypothetical protein
MEDRSEEWQSSIVDLLSSTGLINPLSLLSQVHPVSRLRFFIARFPAVETGALHFVGKRIMRSGMSHAVFITKRLTHLL